MTEVDFQRASQIFFSKVQAELLKIDFQIPSHWQVDHLCYRVETIERYHVLKTFFQSIGQELIESEVFGRPIATYKLFRPLKFGEHLIDVLELPAPKAGKPTPEGLEHIEIVTDQPFDRLIEQFPTALVNRKGLQKRFNQELEVNLQGCAIKFHQLSLESVVTLEGNGRAFEALESSGLLESLKEYEPLIVGTYPLGIHTPTSDVDVLLYSQNLQDLEKRFEIFQSYPEFKRSRGTQASGPFVACRFTLNGVPFELFGQNLRTVQQDAYRHFQVEERLLKLGGPKFKEKIITLRGQGLKTEPTFARALGLQGDAYKKMLELHGSSEKELLQILS